MWSEEYTRNQQQVKWSRELNKQFREKDNTKHLGRTSKRIEFFLIEESLRALWNSKHNNIYITGIIEGEKSKQSLRPCLKK